MAGLIKLSRNSC